MDTVAAIVTRSPAARPTGAGAPPQEAATQGAPWPSVAGWLETGYAHGRPVRVLAYSTGAEAEHVYHHLRDSPTHLQELGISADNVLLGQLTRKPKDRRPCNIARELANSQACKDAAEVLLAEAVIHTMADDDDNSTTALDTVIVADNVARDLWRKHTRGQQAKGRTSGQRNRGVPAAAPAPPQAPPPATGAEAGEAVGAAAGAAPPPPPAAPTAAAPVLQVVGQSKDHHPDSTEHVAGTQPPTQEIVVVLASKRQQLGRRQRVWTRPVTEEDATQQPTRILGRGQQLQQQAVATTGGAGGHGSPTDPSLSPGLTQPQPPPHTPQPTPPLPPHPPRPVPPHSPLPHDPSDGYTGLQHARAPLLSAMHTDVDRREDDLADTAAQHGAHAPTLNSSSDMEDEHVDAGLVDGTGEDRTAMPQPETHQAADVPASTTAVGHEHQPRRNPLSAPATPGNRGVVIGLGPAPVLADERKSDTVPEEKSGGCEDTGGPADDCTDVVRAALTSLRAALDAQQHRRPMRRTAGTALHTVQEEERAGTSASVTPTHVQCLGCATLFTRDSLNNHRSKARQKKGERSPCAAQHTALQLPTDDHLDTFIREGDAHAARTRARKLWTQETPKQRKKRLLSPHTGPTARRTAGAVAAAKPKVAKVMATVKAKAATTGMTATKTSTNRRLAASVDGDRDSDKDDDSMSDSTGDDSGSSGGNSDSDSDSRSKRDGSSDDSGSNWSTGGADKLPTPVQPVKRQRPRSTQKPPPLTHPGTHPTAVHTAPSTHQDTASASAAPPLQPAPSPTDTPWLAMPSARTSRQTARLSWPPTPGSALQWFWWPLVSTVTTGQPHQWMHALFATTASLPTLLNAVRDDFIKRDITAAIFNQLDTDGGLSPLAVQMLFDCTAAPPATPPTTGSGSRVVSNLCRLQQSTLPSHLYRNMLQFVEQVEAGDIPLSASPSTTPTDRS